MNIERQICHCGHALDTHADGGKGQCLGAGCNAASADWSSTAVTNECPRFRDDRKPDTVARPKPNHPGRMRDGVWASCGCFECKRVAP